MNVMYKNISETDSSRYKNCCLCDARVQNSQVRNIDQLFFVESKNEEENNHKSLATILAKILDQEIEETTVHSNIVCRKCRQMCSEYDRLSIRLQELQKLITNGFNVTAKKYNTIPNIDVDLDSNMKTENDKQDLSNLYAIESVSPSIGEVFTENIINGVSKSQMKKVMLIKSGNERSPYYTLSELDEQSDEMHTVLLEEICEEPNEFDENKTIKDVGINDDQQDASEQFIVTEHLNDSKEYFEGHDDQMIEISTNGDINYSSYQYVFQDETIEEAFDEEESSEMSESKSIPFGNEYIKNDIDSSNLDLATTNRNSNKKLNTTAELFHRDGKTFHCLLCKSPSSVVYDTKTIAIHLKTDHNERVYVCSYCGEDFRKRNSYNDHLDEHVAATVNGTFECELCQVNFSDARQFRIHKKSHNSSIKIWPCKVCGKKYGSKNILDEHMNMHTGERPYKCPHCPKDFASKYTLTAHMKIHYDRKRPFECKECGKSFFSNQNLTQHLRIHTGVKEFECDECNKKFGSQHNLEVHKIVHTGHKPFVCRTCNKAFARRAEIKDHERTHTGERPYQCDMCPSSFAQRSNLMSHKRATHFNDKRYKCDTCTRSFKRRRLLEYHIKATHTGERPYKCSTCNATFVYPEHYKKHIRIHTGVKPFACEVCGKKFYSRDNRNAHRYVHSDKKPYECLICHQGFMRKPLLYAHMEAQQHLNDQIIINQPDFKKNSQNKGEDSEIVYLGINDEEFMDDDEFQTLEEEYIVDDSDIIKDEHLLNDGQLTSNDEEIVNRDYKQISLQSKRQNINNLRELADNIKENSEVSYIETTENSDDPLRIDQICVPENNENVSWIG